MQKPANKWISSVRNKKDERANKGTTEENQTKNENQDINGLGKRERWNRVKLQKYKVTKVEGEYKG